MQVCAVSCFPLLKMCSPFCPQWLNEERLIQRLTELMHTWRDEEVRMSLSNITWRNITYTWNYMQMWSYTWRGWFRVEYIFYLLSLCHLDVRSRYSKCVLAYQWRCSLDDLDGLRNVCNFLEHPHVSSLCAPTETIKCVPDSVRHHPSKSRSGQSDPGGCGAGPVTGGPGVVSFPVTLVFHTVFRCCAAG